MNVNSPHKKPPARTILGAVPAHPVYPAYVGTFSPIPSSIDWQQAARLFHSTLGDQVYNWVLFPLLGTESTLNSATASGN
jgi:hypothetical protein